MQHLQRWFRKPYVWVILLFACALCGFGGIRIYPVGKSLFTGIANYQTSNYREAVADLSKVIEVAPHIPEIYYFRGYAYLELRKYEDALADFDTIIQLAPNNVDGYLGRGIVLVNIQKSDEALIDLDKAMALDPYDVDIYNYRGVAHYGVLQYDQAIADYTKALDLDSDYWYAYLNRGRTYHRLFVSAYLDQTTTYTTSQDLKYAIQDFEQYLILAPKDHSERERIIRLLDELKSEL